MTPSWCIPGVAIEQGDKWFANGQSDILSIFGAPAEELYRTGEPASGPITGKIAGNVLSPVTTPHWQQVYTGGGDDPLGVSFDYYSYDSFDAANNTIHDYSTGAFVALVPVMWLATNSANTTLFAKLTASRGWAAYCAGQNVIFILRGTGGVALVYRNENRPLATPTWFAVWRSAALGKLGLYAPWLSIPNVEASETAGDISNTAVCALGSCDTHRADPAVIGPVVVWSGADAETVIAARATVFDAWWAM